MCFKLAKNATETYGMLQTTFRPSCMNRASVFEWHKRFKEGREPVRDDERCGRNKEVNRSESKGLGLGFLCWGFKGVLKGIPSEEASTLQIGSVAFPPGQCTSPQLHPCHRLFDQDGHQNRYSLSSEAYITNSTCFKRLQYPFSSPTVPVLNAYNTCLSRIQYLF